MGGSTSSRWGKNYQRRPIVEETWAIDIAQFLPLLADGKKSRGSEEVIQVTRKTPPESFPANFVLRDNEISIYFYKSDGGLVVDEINVKAFQRKGFFRQKWLFGCHHCEGHFEKLYIRLDNPHIEELFCCRVGSCLTYESRLKSRKG